MRALTILLFLVAAAVPAAAQTSSVNTTSAAAARRVVEQHEQARHVRDWKTMAALFTEDADQLTSAGERRHGRAQIEKGVAESFGGSYEGATYTGRVESVRILDNNAAAVNGTFEISNIGGQGRRAGFTTFLVVKKGDRWQIAFSEWMVPTSVGALPSR